MSDTPIIRVENLSKRFEDILAVNNLSLEVNQGEIYGFLGANGSGKTTTLRMLCGLLTPDNGQGYCLGFDIRKSAHKIKEYLGYMTQKFSLYEELTVEENLRFVARMYRLSKVQSKIKTILSDFNLSDRKDQLAGTLSGGLKQSLALACSLIHNPRLLLLDEPTAGVDPKSRGDFWNIIHQLSQHGITTLVSTHYMDEAQKCSRLAYLSHGGILVQGTIDEIVQFGGLVTYEVRGPDLPKLAERLRQHKDIAHVLVYGATLHVNAKPSEAFDQAVHYAKQSTQTTWARIDTTLEDVFVSLMDQNSGVH